MKTALTFAALGLIGAAAYAPLPSNAQPHVSVIISSAPPAPIYERIPGPRRGYVWAPGYWQWRSQRHAWVPGHYIAARPGYVYAAPSWRQRGGRWYMEPSRWSRHHGPAHVVAGGYRDHDRYDRHERRGHGYGHGYQHGGRDGRWRDTDRDGIPNHRDRDRDNDGISNRHDRDRDGDGVRNRHDRRPDNPYRR